MHELFQCALLTAARIECDKPLQMGSWSIPQLQLSASVSAHEDFMCCRNRVCSRVSSTDGALHCECTLVDLLLKFGVGINGKVDDPKREGNCMWRWRLM